LTIEKFNNLLGVGRFVLGRKNPKTEVARLQGMNAGMVVAIMAIKPSAIYCGPKGLRLAQGYRRSKQASSLPV
tara:strand:+ start:2054 stop:2272 length:219 start_codon:yes stop_codon:yes gene_type:complete